MREVQTGQLTELLHHGPDMVELVVGHVEAGEALQGDEAVPKPADLVMGQMDLQYAHTTRPSTSFTTLHGPTFV